MGQIPTQCDKNCLSHLHEMTRLHFWDKLNYRNNTILIIIINGIWFLIRKKCLKKQQHIHSIWNENFQCNIFLMNKHRPRSVHYSPHSADFTKPPDRRFFCCGSPRPATLSAHLGNSQATWCSRSGQSNYCRYQCTVHRGCHNVHVCKQLDDTQCT